MASDDSHYRPAADFVETDAGGVLRLRGRWTLRYAAEVRAALRKADAGTKAVDARDCERLDTLGVLQLLRYADAHKISYAALQFRSDQQQLVDAIEDVHDDRPQGKREYGVRAMLGRVGYGLIDNAGEVMALVSFFGEFMVKILRLFKEPSRFRLTSTVHHMEQIGLDAVPLVALLSFMVGAVIAFLGAMVLKDFGATIFVVELVSAAFLREFGVLLTAILIAGRSGSAFTAQIGSMKAREEIDAIRTLGLDPVEVLVLPRLLALLIALPLLTLLAMLAGIVGGAVVGALSMDISPTLFLTRLHELGATRHFWVGMSKAPVFAFLIATIGCLEGFKVSGSAASVGTHTTSSVVQAIFMAILVDALAAVFFMEIDV